VYIWDAEPLPHVPPKFNPKSATSARGYGRTGACESFPATSRTSELPIVTDACFVPGGKVVEALIESGLLPSQFNTHCLERRVVDGRQHDLSGAAIIAGDYDGTLRIFLRKGFLDAAFFAAGPEGAGPV